MEIPKKHDSNKKMRKGKHSSLKQALEPRMLFDASLVPPSQEVTLAATDKAVSENTQPNVAEPIHSVDKVTPGIDIVENDTIKSVSEITKSNADLLQEFSAFSAPAKSLVFIDSRLKDPDMLIQGLAANAEVHFIDSSTDGIAQIDVILKAEQSPISSIHILSHGASGAVELGSSLLTESSLQNEYAGELAAWHSYLTQDANVLLYGCGIADGMIGQKFVSDLSKIIGVEVAASIDSTGSSMLGGNWDLEFQTGLMSYGPRDVFSQQALAGFYYVLAKPVLDLNGPTVFTATDNFSTGSYTGGTNWSTGWVEFDASSSRSFAPSGSTNSDNSALGGNIVIPSVATGGTVAGLGTGTEVAFIGHTDQVGDYIGRSVNLMPYTAATLSFSYRTSGLTSLDAIEVNVSNNGGASFVTLGTLANYTTNQTVSFDISNYISDNTVIQFKVDRGFSTGNSQLFFLDNVNITADGNNFYSTFSEQTGTPVPIIGNNATLSDPDGNAIKSASIVLNNLKAGDTLAVGSLPSGITASVDNINGIVTLTSSSPLGTSAANYILALKAITYANTSATLDATTRNITITVRDVNDEVSVPVTSLVKISTYDDPTVTVSHTVAAPRLGSVTGSLFDNSSLATEQTVSSVYDYDKDTLGLTAALVTQGTAGTAVVNPDGTFTYTPSISSSSVSDTFTYSITSLTQKIGMNYQVWNATTSSLITAFPSGAANYSGFSSSFDVDQAAINAGNTALDNFIIRYDNTLKITTAGSYTFYSGSNDGSVVYIDGQLVVNNDGVHNFTEASGIVNLTAGMHTIRVDYMAQTGPEDLTVSYLGPDTSSLKTNLSSAGTVYANNTVTGTVTVNLADNGPRLALGSNTYAADDFSTAAYTNNTGTADFQWAGNWIESNEGTSATAGQILVTGGRLRIQDLGSAGIQSISRTVNLLGPVSGSITRVATGISFDYDVTSMTQGSVAVQISQDGTVWNTLDTLSSATGTTGTKTYDISNYAAINNVTIRFLPSINAATSPVYIDNIKVNAAQVNYTPATYIESGSPIAIASPFTKIADPTGDNLSGATVTIANAQAGDVLSYDNFVAGITASIRGNTLTLSGNKTSAEYAIALQHVFFSNSSSNPSNVDRTINVVVKDVSNNASNIAVTTIGVVDINHAPSGVDKAVSVPLNTTYVMSTADFAISDVDGNTLQAVKVPTLPASVGTLQYDSTGSGNWVAVTVDQVILASDITAGRLRFLPNTGVPGVASFTFQVQDTGGTANGGVNLDSTPNTFSINVLAGPNTAPILTRDLILNSSVEDTSAPISRTILQLMTDGGSNAFSDSDTGSSLAGLVIVGNTADAITQGKWQYSTDGGNWYDIGTVGDDGVTSALLLSSSTQIRFVPVTNFNGTPTALKVRAVDDTFTGTFSNGATRSLINSGTNGGTSSISAGTRNINTTVVAVNDAPVLTSENPVLTSISASQINNAGQLVSDFVKTTSSTTASYVTDVDSGALQGIAIINSAATHGTWEYSTDGGSTWIAVGSVSVNSALLLRSTDKIRFNPDGTAGTGAIGYRAWDQSAGTVGTKVDTSSAGGATAFSLTTDVASIITTPSGSPVLSGTSAPLSYIENAAAGLINTSLVLTDTSTTTHSSATVSIENFVAGQDVLAFNYNAGTMGNITASFNSTTGVLTLTSSGSTATTAMWQAALRAVTYANSSNAPDTTARIINMQVNDSGGKPSNSLSTTVLLTAVNDAPSGANKAITYTKSSRYVFSKSDFGFTDATDNSANNLLAVQITALPTAGTGTLTNNGVAVTANSFISATDIAAGKLVYISPAVNAKGVVTFRVQDDGGTANGGANLSASTNTITFTISANNVAPSLTVLSPVLTTITENDTANSGQTVGSFLGTVTDSAGALKGIAITTAPTPTNGSWQYSLDNGSTWVTFPTVSSTASLLLRSTDLVRFIPNGISGGSGTFTYRAWDQTSGLPGATVSTATTGGSTAFSTNTATASITATAINDAPTATMTASSYSATEQVNLTLSGTGISIADVDAGSSNVSATLSVGEGILTVVAGTTGVSVSGSGTNTVALTGTLTQINNLLAGLNSGSITYNENRDAPAAVTNLTLVVSDLGNTGSGGALLASIARTINITAVNDAPVISSGATLSYTEQGTAAVISSGIVISDVDNSYLTGATVSVGNFVSGDTLTFTAIGSITGTYNPSTGLLTLSGTDTVANYQAVLRSVKFNSTSDDPTVNNTKLNRTITFTVNDGGLTANATAVVNITAVNDAPVVTAGGTLAYTEQGAAAVIDNSITIADVDDTHLASATVSIGNFVAGDVLSFTAVGGITGSYNSSTGVLTLSGTDTLANYQAVLRSVKFSSTSDDPTANNTKPSRTISWQVTDGNSDAVGATNSNLVTSTITLIVVNDAPLVTASSGLAYTANQPASVISSDIVINDSDNSNLTGATVVIGNFVNGDTLTFTPTNLITGNYDASTGLLTLSGVDSIAAYQSVLRSVKFSSTSNDPSVDNTKSTRTITFSVNDGSAVGNATTSIDIVALPVVPPPVTIPSTLTQVAVPSSPQAFFSNSANFSENSFIKATLGETSNSDSSFNSVIVIRGAQSSLASSQRSSGSYYDASWEASPVSAALTPIVKGLTVNIEAMQNDGLSSSLNGESDAMSELTIDPTSSDSAAVSVDETPNADSSVSTKLPINQAKSILQTPRSDKTQLPSSEKAQREAYIERMNFEQRIKALLRDFGLDDFHSKG